MDFLMDFLMFLAPIAIFLFFVLVVFVLILLAWVLIKNIRK